MNLNGKALRIASISDIHLGHPKTTTEFIIANLNKYLNNDEFLSNLDILFFAGDVFDNLLNFNDEVITHIKIWIVSLIRKCHRYNVTVRILEGTPSHDRGQSIHFNTLNLVLQESRIDLTYIDTLSIEYLPKWNIHVLYVPDEWNHDTETTLNEVKALLESKGIESVDFAIMHGMFSYQLPEITKQHVKHNEKEYLKLVKELIFIGHVHKPSNHERIYVQGSFDRLCHGEEENKGFYYVKVNGHQDYEVTFIVNKDAKQYKTFRCYYEDLEESFNYISRKIKNIPIDSFIRIETKFNLPIANALDLLRRKYPQFVWTIQIKDKELLINKHVIPEEEVFVPINITPNTILNLVKDRVNKLHLEPDVSDLLYKNLNEVI